MLDLALRFLKNELNTYLLTQTATDTVEVRLSKLVDETGRYAIDEETLGMTVINIEEDRTFKAHLPEYAYHNGQHLVLEPDIKLNLYILVAANFKQYDQALKYISLVLTFFQAHSCFDSSTYADLDRRIEKLVIELQSLNYEQVNQVWAFIGGKQLPSVIYKVRLVELQDQGQVAIQPPITQIQTTLQTR
ncbi:DUF4255 domain-containing protein [Pantanalinema sp. GBBB05]|uniref:DUF4255 domain-containing protein n=1 Tax=Pantanalinema sp. GBBB05 TaxID=2604139 RepID=UPI001D2DBB16|nr:DUF4255 domain-containing protein [Pantanalinema sp. GBBB05]